ncbi:hypothetical protein SPRG_14394 [Saprolegnia parasitica CBS 223.65]|uniref:MalT-like TPR region domain-containing protein n=1 Tax=Saprolegnia parasitica (strain CBS 223.65) TaxID=695850 RepID=A0A067BXB3_SAPPC|nr:hypothetical protein SPRG_14394 [Saprolegnia parasitica CBS 223.65]KDO18961.1 hypothetical protein SPRG_14394 [Saprolegnia parasitica CBS 223.65]|eukprot:XP_012210342.1 hypothetical protein SPRG_14394 [Saprolegnia parasitica CBS 223.65]
MTAAASSSPARGLRLSYLRHFIISHGGETSFAGKTTAQVCFEFVVPLTKPTELSLVDHVANDPTTADYVSPANWYVSHAWQYLFLETVDSLERFFADRGLSDKAVIWFCVFNNNQHLASSYPFEYWSTTFKNGLAAIGNVVMIMHPWNDPIVLRRSWCVFEVYVAVTMGARFEIALAQGQEQRCIDDIAEDGAFLKMLATIKSEDSETTVPSDRDGIFDLIRAETSFLAVDRLIFSTLSSWIKAMLEAAIATAPSLVEKATRWQHLGDVYRNLAEFSDSERCFRTALALSLNMRGAVQAETLRLQSLVAFAMAHQGKPIETWDPLFRATLSTATTSLGETHPVTLATRGHYVASLGQHEAFVAALSLALEDFDVRRSLHGLSDKRTAKSIAEVGRMYVSLAEPRLASRWLRKAHGIQAKCLGREHMATMGVLTLLVVVLLQMGKGDEALALAEHVTRSHERTLGAFHRNTIEGRLNVATSLLLAGDTAAGTAQLLSVKSTLESRPDLRQILFIVYLNLGIAYGIQGQQEKALSSYRRAFLNVPCKVSAWVLYTVASHGPACQDDMALAREYVDAHPDAAPETWLESCMVCYKPMVGCLVACDACPRDVFKFCTSCRDTRPSRLLRFCRHDLQATKWTSTLPPRRFFLEHDLLATESTTYSEVDERFGAYESYCTTYEVPIQERLRRNSILTLNRGWHPML